tara:strand:+ start:7679 stop:8224 length:546 start_codon:yes stop_codon:yes gene_type:complete
MRALFIVISLLVAGSANAGYLGGFSFNSLLEEEVRGNAYDFDSRTRLFGGYHRENKEKFLLTYVYNQASTTTGSLNIEDTSHELLFWYYKQIFRNSNQTWFVFLGGGLGLTWSDIDTRLGSSSVEETSEKEAVLAAAMEFTRPIIANRFWYATEISLRYAETYSMQPALEFSVLKFYFLWD